MDNFAQTTIDLPLFLQIVKYTLSLIFNTRPFILGQTSSQN